MAQAASRPCHVIPAQATRSRRAAGRAGSRERPRHAPRARVALSWVPIIPFVHGDHTRTIRANRALPAHAARQREHDQPAGDKRHALCGRARLQVAGLPKRFGNWHTSYTRMRRWAAAGVLDRMFEELQREQMVHIKIEAVSLDSTSVKVHPDGIGALKKTARSPSASRAAAGTLRFIWLPRMIERP